MTENEITDFEKIQAQLESLHVEISALTKKSSNDALNKFKLGFANQIINEANTILGEKNKPFKDFYKFDDNDLPSNSDVAMMLGQYLNCMEKFRADNIKFNGFSSWHWLINGKESAIRTAPPKKIK
jgi:hypothetical protein